jgi:hypothetical protein
MSIIYTPTTRSSTRVPEQEESKYDEMKLTDKQYSTRAAKATNRAVKTVDDAVALLGMFRQDSDYKTTTAATMLKVCSWAGCPAPEDVQHSKGKVLDHMIECGLAEGTEYPTALSPDEIKVLDGLEDELDEPDDTRAFNTPPHFGQGGASLFDSQEQRVLDRLQERQLGFGGPPSPRYPLASHPPPSRTPANAHHHNQEYSNGQQRPREDHIRASSSGHHFNQVPRHGLDDRIRSPLGGPNQEYRHGQQRPREDLMHAPVGGHHPQEFFHGQQHPAPSYPYSPWGGGGRVTPPGPPRHPPYSGPPTRPEPSRYPQWADQRGPPTGPSRQHSNGYYMDQPYSTPAFRDERSSYPHQDQASYSQRPAAPWWFGGAYSGLPPPQMQPQGQYTFSATTGKDPVEQSWNVLRTSEFGVYPLLPGRAPPEPRPENGSTPPWLKQAVTGPSDADSYLLAIAKLEGENYNVFTCKCEQQSDVTKMEKATAVLTGQRFVPLQRKHSPFGNKSEYWFPLLLEKVRNSRETTFSLYLKGKCGPHAGSLGMSLKPPTSNPNSPAVSTWVPQLREEKEVMQIGETLDNLFQVLDPQMGTSPSTSWPEVKRLMDVLELKTRRLMTIEEFNRIRHTIPTGMKADAWAAAAWTQAEQFGSDVSADNTALISSRVRREVESKGKSGAKGIT